MSKSDRKVRLQRRNAQFIINKQFAMMEQAAHVIDQQVANIKAVQERNEYWRNLLVACAWDSVTGMERPISEVIRDSAPQLMGLPYDARKVAQANRDMAAL